MYQRFKRSLIKPSELGMYLKDSWIRIWVYFFLLIILGTLPFLFIIYANPGLSSSQIQNISANFVDTLQGDYQVVDGSLVMPVELESKINIHEFDLYAIVISHAPKQFGYQQVGINFNKDYVSFHVSVYLVKTYTYSELGLNGFNFNDYSDQNINRFIKTINFIVSDNQTYNKAFQTLNVFINYLIEYLFFILMGVFLNRFLMKFSLKFKIAVYALTIYVILGLFSILFSLPILAFVGIVLLVVYLNKAFSKIIVN